MLGAPVAGQRGRTRRPARRRLGARAGRTTATSGSDVRSLNDLRWQVTQAALRRRRRLQLLVSDARRSRLARASRSTLDALDDARGRRQADAAHRPRRRRTASRCWARSSAGGAGARGGPAAPATACCAIDGVPIADAQQAARAHPRQRARAAARVPMRWRVERGGQRARARRCSRRVVQRRRQAPIGRIDAVRRRSRREMVHGALRPVEGLRERASAHLGDVGADAEDARQMLIGEASLKNLSGPLTIADYAGQSAQPGPGVLPRLSRRRQREPRRAEPAAAAGARWRAPDVLSFRGRDRAAGLRRCGSSGCSAAGLPSCCMMMSLALYNDVARLLGLH